VSKRRPITKISRVVSLLINTVSQVTSPFPSIIGSSPPVIRITTAVLVWLVRCNRTIFVYVPRFSTPITQLLVPVLRTGTIFYEMVGFTTGKALPGLSCVQFTKTGLRRRFGRRSVGWFFFEYVFFRIIINVWSLVVSIGHVWFECMF